MMRPYTLLTLAVLVLVTPAGCPRGGFAENQNVSGGDENSTPSQDAAPDENGEAAAKRPNFDGAWVLMSGPETVACIEIDADVIVAWDDACVIAALDQALASTIATLTQDAESELGDLAGTRVYTGTNGELTGGYPWPEVELYDSDAPFGSLNVFSVTITASTPREGAPGVVDEWVGTYDAVKVNDSRLRLEIVLDNADIPVHALCHYTVLGKPRIRTVDECVAAGVAADVCANRFQQLADDIAVAQSDHDAGVLAAQVTVMSEPFVFADGTATWNIHLTTASGGRTHSLSIDAGTDPPAGHFDGLPAMLVR